MGRQFIALVLFILCSFILREPNSIPVESKKFLLFTFYKSSTKITVVLFLLFPERSL